LNVWRKRDWITFHHRKIEKGVVLVDSSCKASSTSMENFCLDDDDVWWDDEEVKEEKWKVRDEEVVIWLDEMKWRWCCCCCFVLDDAVRVDLDDAVGMNWRGKKKRKEKKKKC
jgi:hypothetical protein